MTLASTWLDLVVGVDLHMELVPTPAPTPTPFPHPHCSVVFDPIGLVIGEVVGALMAMASDTPVDPGGPVLIGGRMATVTGDAASMPISHIMIPPGTTFVTGVTPSDAELVLGSKTVLVRGANAVRAGEIALSCSEPLRLPTSAVVPTSGGPAVTLIGGPPAIDFGAAAGMLGARLLRNKWTAGKLHAAVDAVIPDSWPRLRRLAHKSACFFTGHPVNVASGTVSTSAVDLSLPGPLPLVLERDYDSNWCDRAGPLGFGWSHALDQSVWIEPGCIALQGGDGRELEFRTTGLRDGVARRGDRIWHPVDRCTLVAFGEHRWEIEDPDGRVRVFSPIPGESAAERDRGRARLVAIHDAAGNAVALHYDERARLIRIVDSAGRTLQLENDNAGRLRRLWTPAPDGRGLRQHAEYRYDAAGDLVEVVDACGKSWTFEYVDHLLVRERDREGLSFYFQYDGNDRFARCVRTWGDGGIYDHVIDYDRGTPATIVTDSLGRATQYRMDGLGMVTQITAPDGSKTRREYAPTTWLTAEIDETGAATRHTYDERGNRVMTVAPAGDAGPPVTKTRFDDKGRVVELVDPLGETWAWRYDGQGHVVARVDPDGLTTTFVWEGGRMVGVVDPVGARTTIAHDTAANPIEITTADGNVRRRSYDATGRMVSSVDALGNTRKLQYDALGRITRVDEPDGNVREFSRDGEGRVVHARDRLHDVAFGYAGMGWLSSRTEGSHTVRWEHDTEGDVVAVIDERGGTHRFERDLVGRVRIEHGIDGAVTRLERDVAGRVVAEHLPGGVVVRHVYDGSGARVQAIYPEGGVERFAYDRAGRLASAGNDDAQLVLERDRLGRVVREITTRSDTSTADRRSVAVQRRYDYRGLPIAVASTLGAELAIERDIMGDVARMTHGGATPWIASFRRNAVGEELERELPGEVRSTWWRDAVGRPTQHLVGGGARVHRQRTYRWDVDDRLASIIEHVGARDVGEHVFDHDRHGRLVSTTLGDVTIDARWPDELGRVFTSPLRDDRGHGDAGELQWRRDGSGTVRYQHDARGRQISRTDADGSTWRFHWNDAGRLTQVDRPDGTAVQMLYDALGRRLSKNAAGQRTCFVWDGARLLHEWGEAADAPDPKPVVGEAAREKVLLVLRKELQRVLPAEQADARWRIQLAGAERQFPAMVARLRRVHCGAEPLKPGEAREVVTWLFEPGTHAPLARLAASGCHAIVADQVGAPLAVIDAGGEASAQLYTDSWGRAVVDGDASLCPWRFAGQYRDDDTGLHYNRFRYYDADAGQYITRDPLGLRAGLRVYGYVEDPWISSDPFGLSKQPGAGCGAAPRGANNPNTRAAATTGQEAHRQIQDELAEHGFVPEVTIRLSDGTVVRKDAVLPGTPVVVVIKPDTPSGRRSGKKRAELMSDEGFEPVVILYDPKDPRYQPGSPTYIGPG